MNIRYGGIHVKATHWNGAFVTQPPRFIEHPLLWLQHVLHTYTPSEKAGLAVGEVLERREWVLCDARYETTDAGIQSGRQPNRFTRMDLGQTS